MRWDAETSYQVQNWTMVTSGDCVRSLHNGSQVPHLTTNIHQVITINNKLKSAWCLLEWVCMNEQFMGYRCSSSISLVKTQLLLAIILSKKIWINVKTWYLLDQRKPSTIQVTFFNPTVWGCWLVLFWFNSMHFYAFSTFWSKIFRVQIFSYNYF